MPYPGRLLDPGMVVVAGTQIQAVDREVQIPDGAQVIDLGGATLLPGSIDAHVALRAGSGSQLVSRLIRRPHALPRAIGGHRGGAR